jgi:hypothetical protein
MSGGGRKNSSCRTDITKYLTEDIFVTGDIEFRIACGRCTIGA